MRKMTQTTNNLQHLQLNPFFLTAPEEKASFYKSLNSLRDELAKLALPHAQRMFKNEYRLLNEALRESDSIEALERRLFDALIENDKAIEKMLYSISYDVNRALIPEMLRNTLNSIKAKTIGDLPEGAQDLFPTIAEEYVAENGANKVKQISKSSKDTIRKIVTQGHQDGWGAPKIARAIREHVPRTYRRRAMNIARTEARSAGNFAQRGIAKTVGSQVSFELLKDWFASPDKLTRDHHAAMKGLPPIPFDQPYNVLGEQMMYPGDSSLGASGKNVCNCRCVELYRKGPPKAAPVVEEPVVEGELASDSVERVMIDGVFYDKTIGDKMLRERFGPECTVEQLARTTGIDAIKEKGLIKQMHIHVNDDRVDLSFFIHRPNEGMVGNLTMYIQGLGKPGSIMHGEYVKLDPSLRTQGFGFTFISRMIETGKALKVQKVTCYAVRGFDMHGYFTWPMAGFDTKNIYKGMPEWQAAIDKSFDFLTFEDMNAAAMRMSMNEISKEQYLEIMKRFQAEALAKKEIALSDCLARPDLRRAWKKHGESISLEFDLDDDSRSMRRWNELSRGGKKSLSCKGLGETERAFEITFSKEFLARALRALEIVIAREVSEERRNNG